MPDSPLFHRVYDDLFGDKDYAGEVQTALELALDGRDEPARVLELGAGTGSHTIGCAQLGHRVTAVEIDPAMVDLLQRRLGALPTEVRRRIRVFNGPVEELEGGPFHAALAMFHVVNYLRDLGTLLSFLAATASRLAPGAAFVFDAWNGLAALLDPPGDVDRRIDTGTHRIRMRLRADHRPMDMETVLTYEIERSEGSGAGSETGSWEVCHTLWHPQLLRHALIVSGFDRVEILSREDPTRRATQDDWKIFVRARTAPVDGGDAGTAIETSE